MLEIQQQFQNQLWNGIYRYQLPSSFLCSSHKCPVNRYFLLKEVWSIQCFHCCLSFLERLIFHKCIALQEQEWSHLWVILVSFHANKRSSYSSKATSNLIFLSTRPHGKQSIIYVCTVDCNNISPSSYCTLYLSHIVRQDFCLKMNKTWSGKSLFSSTVVWSKYLIAFTFLWNNRMQWKTTSIAQTKWIFSWNSGFCPALARQASKVFRELSQQN